MSEQQSSVPAQGGWRQALRGNVLMMGLVSLLTDFSSEMMNPLLPIFLLGLAGDPKLAAVYVGVTEGIAEATASLLKLVSGRISDKLGKRKAFVIIGYGISAIFRPAMAFVAAAWQVVLLKFAERIGKGIRTSPRDALIGDSVSKEYRGLAFSFHRSMDHLGAVLGPVVAIGLIFLIQRQFRFTDLGLFQTAQQAIPSAHEMTMLRVLFGVALIPGIAAMIVLFAKVKEIVPEPGKPGETRTLKGWRQLPRKFYVFVFVVVLFALGNSSDMFLLLYGYDKFGLGLVQIITLWIVLHLSKIFFSLPGGLLSDKLGRRPVIIAGWLVYALVYLGMAQAQQQWQFWVLFIIYGFYYGMTEGAEKAMVTDFSPSQSRGTAFGVYHSAVGFAALPASLLFGIFWNEIGPRWAFGIGAALAGAAAIGLTVLLSSRKSPKKAA